MYLAIESGVVRRIDRKEEAPDALVLEVKEGKEEPLEVGDRIIFTEACYREKGIFTLTELEADRLVLISDTGLVLRPRRNIPDAQRQSTHQMYIKVDL